MAFFTQPKYYEIHLFAHFWKLLLCFIIELPVSWLTSSPFNVCTTKCLSTQLLIDVVSLSVWSYNIENLGACRNILYIAYYFIPKRRMPEFYRMCMFTYLRKYCYPKWWYHLTFLPAMLEDSVYFLYPYLAGMISL